MLGAHHVHRDVAFHLVSTVSKTFQTVVNHVANHVKMQKKNANSMHPILAQNMFHHTDKTVLSSSE